MPTNENEPTPPPSKFLTEMGPLLLFFGVNLWKGIFWATGAFVAATIVAAVVTYRRDKKLPPIMIFTLVVVVLFGGLTIYLRDDRFIKYKVTILNAAFGLLLLIGALTGRNFLKALLGQALPLSDRGWHLLSLRFAAFFLLLAGLNELLWRSLSTDTWVAVKTFGLPAAMFVFMLTQIGLLQRHSLEPAED